MDPVYFAGDRWIVHFLSDPRMCFSQGNPRKLKYCQWLRYGMWSQYPLLGPMLLNLVIQLLMKQGANFMSQKPSELTLWPAFIVLLRIVGVGARVFTMSCEGLQDLAWHLHPLPPHPSLCSSRCDLVVLQLSQACSHLRALPLPRPTYIPSTFFS